MKTQNLMPLALALCLSAVGCAHTSATTEKDLDAKLAAEPATVSPHELNVEAKDAINQMPGLTADQRMTLKSLKDSTDDQLATMHEQSYRLRAVLVKDLLSQKYDDREVELIKSKLKTIEDKRLATIFAAVDKANTLLGHDEAAKHQNVKFMDSLFEGRGQKMN